MNSNGCFAVILLLLCCMASFFLGCLITYDCSFYERECSISVDGNAYNTSTYPYITNSEGTVSFKLKSGERVELPYKEVVIKIKKD